MEGWGWTHDEWSTARAKASSKKNAFAFTLSSDERTVTGELQLTPQEVSSIYKTYTNLGGHKQEFSGLRELWPVAVQK